MPLLEGKTALVTGASRGIGEAIARKFVEQGANVAFTYVQSEDKAKKLQDELSRPGNLVKHYRSDASVFHEAEQLVQQVQQDFGRIDVLVNNAGITKDNLLLRMTEEQWNKVIETNLRSVFNLTRHVAWLMLKQKSGSIINITSISGLYGNPGQANYAASKAGIVGFTKSVSLELGFRNIRCNAISPGFIATDMTLNLEEANKKKILSDIPMNRLGQPGEVADTALFLASDMSSFISGQVISVCGGMYRG